MNDHVDGQTGYSTERTPLLRVSPATRETSNRLAYRWLADEEVRKEYWDEMRVLIRYTVPVYGSQVLEYTLTIASVFTIGHLSIPSFTSSSSTVALAAVTLGSMTANVTGFSVLLGLASSLDTVMPSAWTSVTKGSRMENMTNKERQEMGRAALAVWAGRMGVVMAVFLIPIITILLASHPILILLKQDKDVARLASTYLRWIVWGVPGYAFNCVARRYFQSQNLFTIPTRIICIVAPINGLLNWFLVWGFPQFSFFDIGFKGLGFIGAPIATAISFNLISVMYAFCWWHGVGSSIPEVDGEQPETSSSAGSHQQDVSVGKNRNYMRNIFHPPSLWLLAKLGAAGIAQTASEWWAWEGVALLASLLGPTVLATQSILLVSASTTYQGPFAMGNAVSVRIGNLLGQSDPHRARIAANTSMMLAICVSLLASTMFYTLRDVWGYLFNDDADVIKLVASILPLVALFQVFDAVAAVTAGILRARGKQGIGALLNLSAYYVIGVPLGIYLTFYLRPPPEGLGLTGIWLGLTLSLIYCAAFGVWFSWLPENEWEEEVARVEALGKMKDRSFGDRKEVVRDEETVGR